MPRRTARVASEDSEVDSPGPSRAPNRRSSAQNNQAKEQKVRVKAEKIKIKDENRRRRAADDDDDDGLEYADEEPTREQQRTAPQGHHSSDEEGDEDDDEVRGSPRGAKRQRVNGAGDSRSSPNSTSGGDDTPEVAPKMKTLPRGADGFIPGSIVRIQLKNFVTYDFVEFRPGPYLNMIVGPNGTGKSSIACAIALGLNFSPKILGRASELNAFVKNGTQLGYIEIELKSPDNKPNLVIRRSLSAKDKKSSFHLNGQPATGREINTKMAELNVQVENLCSFLPQDKVSSFAAMTPQQLLVETQKAAGDPNLTNWYETLKSEGKSLKAARQKLKEDEDSTNQMKERNEGIERDVQRFWDRRKIEQEIALLEILMPFARYREMRAEYVELKVKQRKLHAKVLRLKKKNEPAHELLKKLDKSAGDAGNRRNAMKKSMQGLLKQMEKKYNDSEKLDGDAENIINRLGALKQRERDRAKNIKAKENEIGRIEEELAKPPVKLEKMEHLNDEQRQINLEKSAVTQRFDELNRELKEVLEKKVKARENVERAKNSLRNLDTADSKKLALLRKWDQDTHDAVLWLRQNKRLFKMEVFEPPILSVSVKNLDYAAYVEACFGPGQMKSFVAQCKEDLDTLNHHVNDSAALGRKVRVPTWWRAYVPETILPEPMSPAEMAELGFEGYALDYLEYPEGMDYYLRKELNLHRTPISRKANINVAKAMDYIGRPSRLHGGGGTFIHGTTVNSVNRSRYGRKALSNTTRDLGAARNFVVPPVDMAAKQRLEAEMSTNQQEIDLADERKQELSGQMDEVKKEDAEFKKRLESVKQRKDAIKQNAERISRLQARMSRLRDDLQALRQAPSADVERVTLKNQLMAISKKRIKIARDYTELTRNIIQEQTECTQVGLAYLQACANRDALKALCDQKDEKHQKATAEFNEVHARYDELKTETARALDAMRQVAQDLDAELKDRIVEIEASRVKYDRSLAEAKAKGLPPPDATGVELRTVEELETELATQRANLEITINTNPGVVEEYEKRKRDIEQLERTIEQTKAKIDSHERKIKLNRDKWHPALKTLVESIGDKFSAAFDRIGCAGEIRIREDEDYEQWAIEIYVKFRDTEKLQLLTGQRQSGGERSLTTILYLMSLTEEARAPFSLVDEINQGMDQRAERVVHNSMVDVTCRADSAQYFLITPKLLTDLHYHARMKILCVNNGEWLPEERGLGNMMGMIEGFVQRQGQQGRGRGGRGEV